MPPNGCDRRVGRQARRQVARVVGLLRRPHEQVRVLAVLPRDPSGGTAAGRRRCALTFVFAFVRRRASTDVGERLRVGPDVDREHEALAVGEQLEAVDVDRQLRDLLGLAAGRPRSATPASEPERRRQEVDRTCRRRDHVGSVSFSGLRRQPRDAAAVGGREPEVGAARVRVEVGVADRERDPLAVGRHRRLADPLHREHVVDREALGGGGGRRGDRRQRARPGSSSSASPRSTTVVPSVAMLDTLLQYLRTPLVVLSGTPITTLTLFAALGIVIVARIVAAIVGRTSSACSPRASSTRACGSRRQDHALRVITIGVFVALGTIGVDTSAIMAGGAVLLVGIGFGLQKLAENFISGLLLLIERPVRKRRLHRRRRRARHRRGHRPARDARDVARRRRGDRAELEPLISGVVINQTVPTNHRRIWIKVGVAYGTDLELATKVLVDLAAGEPGVATIRRRPRSAARTSATPRSSSPWSPGSTRPRMTSRSRRELRFAIDKRVPRARRSRCRSRSARSCSDDVVRRMTLSVAEARAPRDHRAGVGRGRREAQPDRCASLVDQARRRADRLGQRARALALPAGVLAARSLRSRGTSTRSPSVRRARLFEYWGHEASLLPVALQPLFRWRMDARGATRVEARAQDGPRAAARLREGRARPRRASAGPIAASEIELGEANKKQRRKAAGGSGPMRRARSSACSGAARSRARRGAASSATTICPSACCPAEVIGAPTPTIAEAHRVLSSESARAIGVATEADLRDYYRLARRRRAPRSQSSSRRGVLVAGDRRGLGEAGVSPPRRAKPCRDRSARAARCSRRSTSLIWTRDRTERLFGMRFRLEIYTPEHKRVHGYYVLPFLLGDRLVARVDLKADRKAGTLRVHAAHAEPQARSPRSPPRSPPSSAARAFPRARAGHAPRRPATSVRRSHARARAEVKRFCSANRAVGSAHGRLHRGAARARVSRRASRVDRWVRPHGTARAERRAACVASLSCCLLGFASTAYADDPAGYAVGSERRRVRRTRRRMPAGRASIDDATLEREEARGRRAGRSDRLGHDRARWRAPTARNRNRVACMARSERRRDAAGRRRLRDRWPRAACS